MTGGFDRDRFEAWLALATFRRDLRENRIARQWQASFTAWAAQGGLLWQAAALPRTIVIAASLGLLLVHLGWLVWHSHRAEEDQQRMLHYHDHAEALIKGAVDLPSTPPVKAWYRHPAVWLQLLTTVALSSAVIATAVAAKPARDDAGRPTINVTF
jgi:hypothetical protein